MSLKLVSCLKVWKERGTRVKHVTFFPPRKKRNFEKYDGREFRCSGVWWCVVGLVVPGISDVRRSPLTAPQGRPLSLATLLLELQISQVWLSFIFIEKLLLCFSPFITATKLTPCRIVLPEKPTGPQVVGKFPAFYGTHWFLTMFTSAHHLPFPESDKSSPCLPIQPREDPF
jgi:hypothetical protein